MKSRMITYGPSIALLVGLVLITTWKYGIGVYSDSVGYSFAARSLADFEGLKLPSVEPYYNRFLPVYPFLLASFPLLGMSPEFGALVLNLVLGVATLIGLGLLFRQAGIDSRTISVSLSLVALSQPSVRLVPFMYSAIPLVALITWFFVFIVRWKSTGQTRCLVAAAIASGFATITNYLGFTFIVVGALSVLMWHWSEFRIRLRNAAIFGAAASAPVITWVLWVILGHGTEASSLSSAANLKLLDPTQRLDLPPVALPLIISDL